MTLPKMKTLGGIPYEVSQLQANVKSILDVVSANPLLDGRLIQEVPLTMGVLNPVEHKLGRDYIGYIITKQVGGAEVYIVPTDQTMPNKFLVLKCSVDCEVDLYVF